MYIIEINFTFLLFKIQLLEISNLNLQLALYSYWTELV